MRFFELFRRKPTCKVNSKNYETCKKLTLHGVTYDMPQSLTIDPPPRFLGSKGAVGPQSNISRSLPQSAQAFGCRLSVFPLVQYISPSLLRFGGFFCLDIQLLVDEQTHLPHFLKSGLSVWLSASAFFKKSYNFHFVFFTFCFKQKKKVFFLYQQVRNCSKAFSFPSFLRHVVLEF